MNLLDGSRGYAKQYQMEAFCHNNPDFLAMHSKYLKRLLNEVPLDGIEVDDMCDYAGLIVCGCTHCRERFKRDFGHEIPPLDNKDFWGNVNLNEFLWGNYANPVFRDWIRMRAESVADHLKMVKTITGKLPLMTCCSSSGPIALNAVNLNLERMASSLDFFMLENCGISVNSVNWTRMDPEAMHQKDIAASKGNAPPLALSYTIYEKGAYLGWCLSRFWGVANWSSTLNQRLEEDPVDMKEIEDIIGPYNNWELINSNLNYRDGSDLVEVRLVNSRFCRENGWRDEKGKEQWEKAAAWSELLVNSNIGYRFVRCEELAEPSLLKSSTTPLILDGIGCVSENQFRALKSFLSSGGKIWLALPFGTHDEKGFKRKIPLSDEILRADSKNITLINSATETNPLEMLISERKFIPVLKQVEGDQRWAARIRFYDGKTVIHLLSRGLKAIPHPFIKDIGGTPVLKDIDTVIRDKKLEYEINTSAAPISDMVLMSPEIGNESRKIRVIKMNRRFSKLSIDLEGIKIYAVAQNAV